MPDLSFALVLQVLTIVLIDLLLAGDNAVVIAMAVKTLPAAERRLGIMIGAALAVFLRIALTFFAAQLLLIHWLKFGGGLFIFWIAIKMLTDAADEGSGTRRARGLWNAVWLILVADVTMSFDNIIAVAGTSKGSLTLLIFGLGLSVPFIVFTSNLLSTIMDRYPVIVWIGAAVLGRVGAEMMITDPAIAGLFQPSLALEIAVQVVGAVLVVGAGKMLTRPKTI